MHKALLIFPWAKYIAPIFIMVVAKSGCGSLMISFSFTDLFERIYQEASEKPEKKFSKTTMAALRNSDESCDSSNVEGDEESITIEADLLAFDN